MPGGEARLLRNVGDGTLENVTELVGLPVQAQAHLALWGDYDADGALDLYLGSLGGESRLFRQTQGVFRDVSDAVGLDPAVAPRTARWIDYDRDGWRDLVLTSARALPRTLRRLPARLARADGRRIVEDLRRLSRPRAGRP